MRWKKLQIKNNIKHKANTIRHNVDAKCIQNMRKHKHINKLDIIEMQNTFKRRKMNAKKQNKKIKMPKMIECTILMHIKML